MPRGWHWRRLRLILLAMNFLTRLSPFRAIRDLRFFLAQRQPYELGFLALSMVVTTAIIAGFVKDSRVEKPYKKNIVYVEQWPLTRTNAEIVAQQKIDQVERDKEKAEQLRREKELQAEFKKLDDRLKAVGL